MRQLTLLARYLIARGCTVVLLPPHYVKPYRRRNKTDRPDCEAHLEADRCADIHPVTIKSEDQQAQHAARARTPHGQRALGGGLRTRRIDTMEAELERVALEEPVIQALLKIPDIGLLTATALFATAADIHAFKNGRQLACWLGLTPPT